MTFDPTLPAEGAEGAVQRRCPRRGPSLSIPQLFSSLRGRIPLVTFWLGGLLPWWCLSCGVVFGGFFLGGPDLADRLLFLWVLLAIWPLFSLLVKRAHDRGRSGWILLLWLVPDLWSVPVAQLWLLFDLGFLRGTRGPNRFGPDPLDAEIDAAKGGLVRGVARRGVPVVGAVLLCAMGVALFLIGEVLPPESRVVRGEEMNFHQRGVVRSVVDLDPGEEVRFLYGEGRHSYEEGGTIITDRRVLSYDPGETGPRVFGARYEQIEELTVERTGADTKVWIKTQTASVSFLVYLSPEEGRDQQAIEYLKTRIREEGGTVGLD